MEGFQARPARWGKVQAVRFRNGRTPPISVLSLNFSQGGLWGRSPIPMRPVAWSIITSATDPSFFSAVPSAAVPWTCLPAISGLEGSVVSPGFAVRCSVCRCGLFRVSAETRRRIVGFGLDSGDVVGYNRVR
jgi:hypothetical protein